MHVAVICACAPGLKPLVTRVWPKFDEMRRKYSLGHGTVDEIPRSPNNSQQSQSKGSRFSARFSSFNWNTAKSNDSNTIPLADADEDFELPIQQIEPIGRAYTTADPRPFSQYVHFPQTPSCENLHEAAFQIRRSTLDGTTSRRHSIELPPPARMRSGSYDSYDLKSATTRETEVDLESLTIPPHWH